MIIRRSILNSMISYGKHKKDTLGVRSKRNKLVYNLRRSNGRNNSGVITVRHKSAGCKKLYREINFKRDQFDKPGIVENIEYDPNRNAFISLVRFPDNEIEYNIHIEGVKIGDMVISSKGVVDIKPGNATILKYVPQGAIISCIAIRPNDRAKLARSAGAYATVMEHFVEAGVCLIKMSKSGFVLKIKNTCMVTLGEVSNSQFKNKMLYKAGTKRLKGIRPTVRGVAMNPVDHAHGGGEGRGTTKRQPVSYTNKLAKGGKTIGARGKNSKIVVSRRIKKKKS